MIALRERSGRLIGVAHVLVLSAATVAIAANLGLRLADLTGFGSFGARTAYRSIVFLVACLVGIGLVHRRARRSPSVSVDLWLASLAPVGLALLLLAVNGSDISRASSVIAFACALLIPLHYVLSSKALVVELVAVVAVSGFGVALIQHQKSASSAPGKVITELIQTEYYTLEKRAYPNLIPKPAIKGGGITRVGNDFIVATGEGLLYRLEAQSSAEAPPKATKLKYRVPLNGEDFARSAGQPWATPLKNNTAVEGNRQEESLHPEWFRVSGLMAQEMGSRIRLFASHLYWYPQFSCWVVRVSALEGQRASILDGTDALWRTIFETKPCLPAHGPLRRHGIPIVGYFGGGRMALLDGKHLLVSVGDFGFDGVASPQAIAQDPGASYGKTIKIDLQDESATVYTTGHRNPQGLYVSPDGAIWLTEHGPKGGDELNRLTAGGNFGWPYATYGTDYGSHRWPAARVEGEHHGFLLPTFSWYPSIGVSALLGVEGSRFPMWRGDLLISSLTAQTLFRARIRENRVVYAEPIALGCAVRDFLEATDGRIVVWSQGCGIMMLQPMAAASGEALFDERCSACHQSQLVSGNRIGPNLHGVVGRRMGSLEGYPDYSPCLGQQTGVWDRAALHQFIADPVAFCADTKMEVAGVASKAERDAIIDFLETLH